MAWDTICEGGGVAVITGGASGVGYAAAEHLGALGFDLLLADISEDALAAAKSTLEAKGASVATQRTDVTDRDAIQALADTAFKKGPIAVLMNNAGIALPSKSWDQIDNWHTMLNVNLFGILNGLEAFVPRMVEADRPAIIVNTGSKQGITSPPGNPGYNASKAAVKALTEQLAHELRQAGAPISVHLFVPGFTYTGMIAAHFPEKPPGAWSSAETVAYLFEKVASDKFYVLCPDNMVTESVDAARVLWSAQDILENRPPLSRWHPDWKEAFAAFEAKNI